MKKRFTSLFPTHAVAAFHSRFFWLGCLFIWSVAASAQTTTRFVSTTGTNSNPATATSWATATADLQGAINSLSAGGEVWVAGGTYKPTTGTDREIWFNMKNNVAIYGGFVGNEANRSDRPPINLTTPSSTTLSGDIGNEGDPGDNSYHVIYNLGITSTAILDGVVITGGNANYDNTNDYRSIGGGMYNAISSPILTNCRFISNKANTDGGGMYNASSSPILTNCSFTSNSANGVGGAMINNNSNPSLTNCSFTSNTAGRFGGGMANSASNPSLTNCSFTLNSANFTGGGMDNNNSNPSLTNCTFASNTSSQGAGMFSDNSGNSSLINCIFWNNDGNNTLYNGTSATVTASYCLFEPSVTGYTSSNSLTTTTSPFVSSDNFQLTTCSPAINAGDPASATAVSGPYSVTALPQTDLAGNARIYGNRVDMGAYELQQEPAARIIVSTLASSASVTIGQAVSLSATVAGGSTLSYDWAAPAGATLSSTTANPVSATLLTTGPKAFMVTVTNLTSGCTATSSVTVTVTSNDVPSTTRFVSTTGTNSDPATATSWATATSDLQGAINSLSAGGEVWVAGGTYKPTTGTDRNSSFSLKNNVAIYGGFVGNEANRSERPALNLTTPSSTTLSGDIGTGDPGDNSYHVISNTDITSTAILDGFVITGGNANFDDTNDPRNSGGGMANANSSPSLINCLFIANTAISNGGGMYNDSSNPSLTNCSFTSNATDYGGGMYNVASSPSLTNCLFTSNSASSFGGGMYNNIDASPVLANCSFNSNTAGNNGGGMYNYISSPSLTSCSFTSNIAITYGGGMYNNTDSSPILTNCSFTSNTANEAGGGINNDSSSPILTNCRFNSNSATYGGGINNNNSSPSLTNCTFASNTATNQGGGMYSENSGNPSLINCIFWNNGGTNTLISSYGATTTAHYCLFEPSVTDYTGSNILTTTTSPFVSSDNLQLTTCSVAVNAGDPASATAVAGPYSVTALPQTDMAGNPRIFGNQVDIGAYELQQEPGGMSISTLASSASVCVGQSVSLSATVEGGSNLSYGWAAPAGASLSSTSTNPVSATLLTTGPKAFTVTVTDLSSGCTATSSVTVTGSVAPTAVITPSSATLTCASPTVSLTASGGSSYRWDDNSTNAIRTVSVAGPYSVTVTAGGSCSAVAGITVSGNDSGTPAPPNLTSTTVTQGAPTVNLTASNCAGTLTWNGPGGASGTGAIAVLTTNTGIFVYQATCTVGGCVSDPASATVVVTAPTVTGSFDGFIYGADCSSFRGWAWDRNKSNTAILVEILVDSESKGTILANEFRQDLKDGGKGNGIHAFRWVIPDDLKDGEVHTLSAVVAGSGFTLKDGPKTIRCQNGTPPPPPNKPPVAPAMTPLTIQQGVNFTTTLPVFTDPENGILSYALAGLPGGLTFTSGTRQMSGKTEIAGSFALTYSATDDKGATNSVSFNLTVNPAETVVTGSFEGYLDKLDCGGIRGWVWDRNKPNTPITVEFYLEPSPGTITPLGSTLANIYRVDLKEAGKGNGAHAYNFTPPGSVTNGTRVLARVLGSTFILKGSPKEYQCNAPTRLSAESTTALEVMVLGNPVSNQVEVEIRGAEGKPLHVQLTDINGHLVSEQRVPQAATVEHHRLLVFHQAPGVLLLRVSTPTQQKTARILKGK
ncbi:choice-of-anchor Q domain-containing protein [Larkinella sp. GY13]|uniref:choice-of-anchor Q domain-containing protein n=1 Tax=Larkinella sp. GY13 TaxID=3453720 RepID=UPI003EEBCD01